MFAILATTILSLGQPAILQEEAQEPKEETAVPTYQWVWPRSSASNLWEWTEVPFQPIQGTFQGPYQPIQWTLPSHQWPYTGWYQPGAWQEDGARVWRFRDPSGQRRFVVRFRDGKVAGAEVDGDPVEDEAILQEGGWVELKDKDGKRIIGFRMPQEPRQEVRLQGRRRIGVTLEAAGEALAAQLDLDPAAVVVITGVLEGLPAEKAGLQPFDVVVGVEGKEDASEATLRAAIQERKAGDTLELKVLRQTRPLEIQVVVEEEPAEAAFIQWEATTTIPDWTVLQPRTIEWSPLKFKTNAPQVARSYDAWFDQAGGQDSAKQILESVRKAQAKAAEAQEKVGAYQEALQQFLKARAMQPEVQELLAKAREAAEKASKLNVAEIYQSLGQAEKALKSLEEAKANRLPAVQFLDEVGKSREMIIYDSLKKDWTENVREEPPAAEGAGVEERLDRIEERLGRIEALLRNFSRDK